MDAVIAQNVVGGDKEALVLKRTTMPQLRWPYISTSVAGIAPEDWTTFKARVERDKIKQQDAIEQAIKDLAEAVRRGDTIEWQPSKTARSRAVRMHDDTHKLINQLVDELDYKQNIVVGTALHRWAHRPSD
jgi:hypothetical protein